MTERSSRLIRLLVEDVDAGFEQIVRDHAGAVLTLARRIDRNSGEDVAQESFARALRSLRAMDPGQIAELNIVAWLLTITRHTAYNDHRARRRRPVIAGDLPPDHPGTGDGPSEVAERADTTVMLRAGLDRLPSIRRDAVVLRHVLDLSSRETAMILDCNESTLKSHLARGLRQLRTDLGENFSRKDTT